MTVSGWDIRTRRTPILGKEALAGLEARLGTPHLPEMVYGSVLELTHAASDTRVHFNAEDALREWLEEDLPPLKVAAAAKWAEAHKLRFGGGLPPSKAAGAGSAGPAAAWDTNQDASVYDWTFTTPDRGSLGTASGDPSNGAKRKRWAETSRRVDRGRAARRGGTGGDGVPRNRNRVTCTRDRLVRQQKNANFTTPQIESPNFHFVPV